VFRRTVRRCVSIGICKQGQTVGVFIQKVWRCVKSGTGTQGLTVGVFSQKVFRCVSSGTGKQGQIVGVFTHKVFRCVSSGTGTQGQNVGVFRQTVWRCVSIGTGTQGQTVQSGGMALCQQWHRHTGLIVQLDVMALSASDSGTQGLTVYCTVLTVTLYVILVGCCPERVYHLHCTVLCVASDGRRAL